MLSQVASNYTEKNGLFFVNVCHAAVSVVASSSDHNINVLLRNISL